MTAVVTVPPAWAVAKAEHDEGLRRLVGALLQNEPNPYNEMPWALDSLFAAVPECERERLLGQVRKCLDEGDDGAAYDDALDALLDAHEVALRAALTGGA